MKVICPLCHEEVIGDDVPEVVKNAEGRIIYTCHRKFCNNKDKHPNHDKISVIFKP